MNPLPAPSPAARPRAARRVVLGSVCLLVLAIFWASAHPGLLELLGGGPTQSYYNLLVEGFQDGQLSLRKPVPPDLVRLADPYDPAANHPYRTPPTLAAQISLNLLAQIIPGTLLPGQPLANMFFKAYSVQTLTESTSFIQDLKLGHYIKVPPRATFIG